MARKLLKAMTGTPAYSGTPPIMAFEFAEVSGPALYDTGSAPNGRTVTLNANAQLTSSVYGQCLEFLNATHSGLQISGTDTLAPLTGSYTVEVMCYCATGDQYPVALQLSRGTGRDPFIMAISDTTNYKSIYTRAIVDHNPTIPSCPSLFNRWAHVLVTVTDDHVAKILVNGVSYTIVEGAGFFSGTANKNEISTTQANALIQFKGLYNFIRVYNYATTSPQDAELFALSGL